MNNEQVNAYTNILVENYATLTNTPLDVMSYNLSITDYLQLRQQAILEIKNNITIHNQQEYVSKMSVKNNDKHNITQTENVVYENKKRQDATQILNKTTTIDTTLSQPKIQESVKEQETIKETSNEVDLFNKFFED